MSRPRYAIIPTNNRECLGLCLQAIAPQVDKIILIETAEPSLNIHAKLVKIHDPRRPVNIYRWWNRGLRHAAAMAKTQGAEAWDVAILNDDVVVPEAWFANLAEVLRATPAAIASYTDQIPSPHHHTSTGQIPLYLRPMGFAWMMRGELDLRADEQFHWYCGDDDLWRGSIEYGGYYLIPGTVNHMYPNAQVTPEIHELIANDMATFVTKHGERPW